MLEPVVSARAVADLAEVLIGRAVAAEPAIRAERELFVPLARAYFRDRERALAGAAVPLTTVLLEAARTILDHRVEEQLGPPRGAVPLHRRVSEVLSGSGRLPADRADRLAGTIMSGPRRLGEAA